MTLAIILDTTETFGYRPFESPDFRLLHRFVSRHPARIVIPQVVVEETINHFRQELHVAVDDAATALRTAARLMSTATKAHPFECDVEAEVANFREQLTAQLKELNVACPPYDGIKLSSLLGRALARRKPFDGKGQVGFRDALIWESVLAYLELTKPIEAVLVTRNKRDFGEHGTLAADLSRDVESLGLCSTAVKVCGGLKMLVDERVKPSLETLDQIARDLNKGEYHNFDPIAAYKEWFDLIRDKLADSVRALDLNRLVPSSLSYLSRPTLGRMSVLPDDYEAVDVWRLSPTELAIGINFVVAGSIRCEREYGWGSNEEVNREEFAGWVKFTLMMTVVFDESTKEVESWELDDFEVHFPKDW